MGRQVRREELVLCLTPAPWIRRTPGAEAGAAGCGCKRAACICVCRRAGGRTCMSRRAFALRCAALRCVAAGPRQAVERTAAPSTSSVLWPPTHTVMAGAAARASVRCRARARAAGGRAAETTVHLVNGRPTLVSDHQEQQVHTLETTGLPRQIRESMLHTTSHCCCGVRRRAQLRLAACERSE